MLTVEDAGQTHSSVSAPHYDWPRVLIVSDAPFSEFHGVGVTLTNFFEGWPAESLAMLCSAWSPMAKMEHHRARCARMRTFRIPGPGGRLDWVKSRLGLAPVWRAEPSHAWHRAWFHAWRPDVIYSIFVDLNTFAYADWLGQFLGVPHVCHITDDITPSVGAFGADRLRDALGRAAYRLAISDEMKIQYEALAKAEFAVLHNGATEHSNVSWTKSDGELVLRYLGSVSIVQHAALVDLAAAVRLANARGTRCRLEIACSFWDLSLDASFVDDLYVRRTGPYLPADVWTDLMASADLLVIPVGFATNAAIDVRLSLPTKLLDYLASGTPVVVYGPADAAPCAFCRRHGFGTVIDNRDPDVVARFLQSVSQQPTLYRERAARDRVKVLGDFSSATAARRFQRLLFDAAAQS